MNHEKLLGRPLTDFEKDTIARIEAYQRKEREEQQVWTKANQNHIRRLKKKLLAIGGKRVDTELNHLIQIVVSHGELFQHSVLMREMEPCRCHRNVSELWRNRRPKGRLFAICTGYGLSAEDDMWRPHSWALSKTSDRISIIETTVARAKYFGLILTGKGANMFAEVE